MSYELRNYYKDSKGRMRYISYPKKCEMTTMYTHVLPDCVGVPNINRIYPLKQRIVRDIYYKLTELGTVEELWIFGSSTNMLCNIFSDLDIAYRMKDGCEDNMHTVLCDCDPNGYDLLNMDRIQKGEKVLRQIRKGARII